MSNFYRIAVNKKTKEEFDVFCCDDHFGKHKYGYSFDGKDFMTLDQFNMYWEWKDE